MNPPLPSILCRSSQGWQEQEWGGTGVVDAGAPAAAAATGRRSHRRHLQQQQGSGAEAATAQGQGQMVPALVSQLHPETGAVLSQWAVPPSPAVTAVDAASAHSISVDTKGNVWVVEAGPAKGGSVRKFSPQGQLLMTAEQPSTSPLCQPTKVGPSPELCIAALGLCAYLKTCLDKEFTVTDLSSLIPDADTTCSCGLDKQGADQIQLF